jgi:hypothetical protein
VFNPHRRTDVIGSRLTVHRLNECRIMTSEPPTSDAMEKPGIKVNPALCISSHAATTGHRYHQWVYENRVGAAEQ